MPHCQTGRIKAIRETRLKSAKGKKGFNHVLRPFSSLCASLRLKIIWKMWQTGTAYDPELHARNQLQHGSWVLQLLKAKTCE